MHHITNQLCTKKREQPEFALIRWELLCKKTDFQRPFLRVCELVVGIFPADQLYTKHTGGLEVKF